MSEGEVVSELVEFTNIVLVGVSLIFSIISAYVVALNYFIGSAAFYARLGGFIFITLVLGLLVLVMMGAQATHAGLIDRLRELQDAGQLTAAGRAVLANASPNPALQSLLHGQSIDAIVTATIWISLGFIYAVLAYMTFLHRWTPDAIPVTIEDNRSR
jgi:hypothetical protein